MLGDQLEMREEKVKGYQCTRALSGLSTQLAVRNILVYALVLNIDPLYTL